MRMHNKILVGFLSLCLLTAGNTTVSLASETTQGDKDAVHNTTYTITLYAGKQGTITNQGTAGGQVDGNSSKVVIKELEYGSQVNFYAQDMVELGADSKYYVKGIRESGRDNGEAVNVSNSSITVTEDRDYVVYYGIKGELVAYKVNYQDASGRQLAGSRKYYGNIGDKPVVAFLYLEGYEPQAYNLTKTLSANETENVFTFIYTPVQNSTAGSGSGEETVITEEENIVIAQDTGVTVLPGNNADNQGAEGTAEETVEIDGEETPQGAPSDIVDLDDDEVPMAGRDGIEPTQGSRLIHGAAIIGVGGAAALILLMVLLKKCMKKQKET